MSIIPQSFGVTREDLVGETNSSENAFVRARFILRQEREMTVDEFHELDRLFLTMSPAQFTALTTDNLHLAQLRRYEILAWRHPRGAAPILAMFLILAMATAIAFAWQ